MTTASALQHGGGRAALALAVSRIRRRYLRSVLGFAWFFVTPAAIFLLYWFVFGQAFHVTWRNPSNGQPMGYIAPFAIGYSFYLFLADAIGTSASSIRGSANLLKRGGIPASVIVASFGLEFLIKFSLYLAIALVLALTAGVALSVSGAVTFGVFLALFVVQVLSIALALMFLTPFISDLAEIASLGLRVFVYAAGLSFPLTTYPAALARTLMAAPLTGPLNGARNALLFGTAPELSVVAAWAGATAILAAFGGCTYALLRRRVLEVL